MGLSYLEKREMEFPSHLELLEELIIGIDKCD